MKFCAKCGFQMQDTDAFCVKCGNPATGGAAPDAPKETKWYDKVTAWINQMTGGMGAVRPPLGRIFSNVFAKHTRAESEEIFICGTEQTTPVLTDDGKAWPRPWLWSRILLVFVAAFALLHVCCSTFDNLNAYPGLMVMGAFMIPVAVMVFFFELNTPKNISFFSIIKYFLIGGCASLVVTLLLNDFVTMEVDEWVSAMLTGIIEEVAKLAIVAIILLRNKNMKYALNGLLVGAAIGAGFAAFESAGYAFNIFLGSLLNSQLNVAYAYSEMMDNIILRALLAPGGHVIWAAMSGYAIMLVKKNGGEGVFFLNQKAFWKIFWIPILLHAVWDMPIALSNTLVGVLAPIVVLVVLGWVVVFVFIGNALEQIGQFVKAEAAAAAAAESQSEEQPTA